MCDLKRVLLSPRSLGEMMKHVTDIASNELKPRSRYYLNLFYLCWHVYIIYCNQFVVFKVVSLLTYRFGQNTDHSCRF